MINSANRGSGVSCYRVKTENNDSPAPPFDRIDPAFRVLCSGDYATWGGELAGSLNRAEVDLSSKVSRRCRVKRTVYFRTSLLDRARYLSRYRDSGGEKRGGGNRGKISKPIKAFPGKMDF